MRIYIIIYIYMRIYIYTHVSSILNTCNTHIYIYILMYWYIDILIYWYEPASVNTRPVCVAFSPGKSAWQVPVSNPWHVSFLQKGWQNAPVTSLPWGSKEKSLQYVFFPLGFLSRSGFHKKNEDLPLAAEHATKISKTQCLNIVLPFTQPLIYRKTPFRCPQLYNYEYLLR